MDFGLRRAVGSAVCGEGMNHFPVRTALVVGFLSLSFLVGFSSAADNVEVGLHKQLLVDDWVVVWADAVQDT